MSTISKGNYHRRTGTLSGGILRQDPIAPLLLGFLFFFIVCLSASDSMPVLMMIVAVFMLIVMAVRFGVLRERYCIPFLALTLYVIMDGVSTFWALAPKFALREFLKVFLAFALAVIMLATSSKKEEQTGRRIATILAVCAALGSLISIDMFSTHILSGAWFWVLGHFTEAYIDLQAIQPGGTRMLSMFVNPNPYAGFAAIGVLLSLGLANTAPNKKERCVALVLLYISALGFLLAFSMGSCVFIALAFLVFLALEHREKRIELFFLMLETAVLVGIAVALIASTSFYNTDKVQILPLACTLLGAAALCLLDSFAVGKIAEKLKAHGKLVLIVVLAIIVLAGGFAVAAWNLTEEITLSAGESLKRAAYPEPGEYTLDIQIDGASAVMVDCMTRRGNRMFGERVYNGDVQDAHFIVPENCKVVYFEFYSPTGATIYSASVGGAKIPLHYKLLPGFISTRIQGIRANENAIMRLAHFEDGMKLFKRSPIIGLGMGSFENAIKSVQSFYYETKYAHNHYIQALLDTGIIGLILFLGVLVTNVIATWKAYKKRERFAPMLGAVLIFMFGHATMEIDFCSNSFLPMAFGSFAMISLCFGDTMEKPKLSNVVKTVSIGVIAVLTVIYCGFITGNLMAKQHIKRDASMQGLVRCVELDRFEWADYALPYVINAMDENTNVYVREQADIFAERLGKVNSNTIPIYLAEYYFRTDRTEPAVAMVEKYVRYLASDQNAWNMSFNVLLGYENGSEAFRSAVVRIADWRDTWNANNAGHIDLNDQALALIERCRQ